MHKGKLVVLPHSTGDGLSFLSLALAALPAASRLWLGRKMRRSGPLQLADVRLLRTIQHVLPRDDSLEDTPEVHVVLRKANELLGHGVLEAAAGIFAAHDAEYARHAARAPRGPRALPCALNLTTSRARVWTAATAGCLHGRRFV